jgi:cytoskeletal protein CcmA (bactofilin family)
MFSKSRPNDSVPQPTPTPDSAPEFRPAAPAPAAAHKPKPPTSVLASDISITGNVRSSGDIQIEGTIDGDVRAQVLIVGESASVKGEVVAEEIVVHGRVVGRLRGARIRLSATARVEGDLVHKTLAIENGAQFEGSVHREEDPLSQAGQTAARPPRLTAPQPQPAAQSAPVEASKAAE